MDLFAAAMPLWGDPVAKVAIAGDPTTKARPRFGGGRAYSSDRMRAAQNAIGWSLKAAKVPYVDDSDLAVVIHFETKTMQRRDLDNLVKLVLDGATGIAWRDDEQITKILADVQRGSAHPCTEITIYRVGNPYGITCPICNQRSSPKGRSRGPYRATYCSKKCYDEAQRRGQYRACAACGKNVYRQAEKLIYEQSFCSAACKAKFKRLQALAHRLGAER